MDPCRRIAVLAECLAPAAQYDPHPMHTDPIHTDPAHTQPFARECEGRAESSRLTRTLCAGDQFVKVSANLTRRPPKRVPKTAFFDVSNTDWLDHFHSEGYAVLRSAIPDYVLKKSQKRLEAFVDKLAQHLVSTRRITDAKEHAPFSSRLLELTCSCEDELPNLYRAELHESEFFPLLCHPNVLAAAKTAMPNVPALRIYPKYVFLIKLFGLTKYSPLRPCEMQLLSETENASTNP